MAPTVIASNMSGYRISRLQEQMARTGIDLAVIAPTANMRYLLGFAPLADERPCALLVTRDDSCIVVPELNADQVERFTGMTALRWPDVAGARQAFVDAVMRLGIRPGLVLAADDAMRADALILVQEVAEPRKSVPAGGLMAGLRMRKSDAEIAALAQAAVVGNAAIMAGAEACQPGVTERYVSEQISHAFRLYGADEVNFTTIGSGPNGAFPHHEFSDRLLELGDMIVLDIGATLNGYHSDVTRMVHLGEPTAQEREVFDIVLEANLRGREAAVAGVLARDVDHATREVIEMAGYGPQFIHRTGHGLGLEVHESPWITSESETLLEPGMVFSIEPGIYLPGRFGVRIEDIIVVTEGASRALTTLDRAMIIR
jgi:Xaa-Pro dipeptidase